MSSKFPITVHTDNFLKRGIGKEHTRRMQAYEREEHSSVQEDASTQKLFVEALPPDPSLEESCRSPRYKQSWGLRATDVTSKQNCAYVKWYQHDSSDDSPARRSRRLQQSGARQAEAPMLMNNTLLGGGHSDYISWRTSTQAAYKPPDIGTSNMPAAGMSSGDATASDIDDYLNPRHGRRVTEITSKQNCAYVKWYQQDTNDESPLRMSRRLEHGAIVKADPSHKTGLTVPNVLLGGSHSDYVSRSVGLSNSARF